MKTARIILIYLAVALAAAVCGVLFGATRVPLSEFVQDGALNPIVELRIVRTASRSVWTSRSTRRRPGPVRAT